MGLTDDDLEAAILFPSVATAMIEIVKKCHYPMGQFARLEAERLLQQERANREAIERCEAKERLKLANDIIADVWGQYALDVTVDGEQWMSDGCLSTMESIADYLVGLGVLTKHKNRRLYRMKP